VAARHPHSGYTVFQTVNAIKDQRQSHYRRLVIGHYTAVYTFITFIRDLKVLLLEVQHIEYIFGKYMTYFMLLINNYYNIISHIVVINF